MLVIDKSLIGYNMSEIAANKAEPSDDDKLPLVPAALVYKIADKDVWDQAKRDGVFEGAAIDISDGFIHFSTAEQVASTAQKHFAGVKNLVLAAIDAKALVGQIVYEEARGGELFPHLYQPLPMDVIVWTKPLVVDENGAHIIPDLEP